MLNIINAVVVVDGVCYANKLYNCYIIYYLCLVAVAETKPTKGRQRAARAAKNIIITIINLYGQHVQPGFGMFNSSADKSPCL